MARIYTHSIERGRFGRLDVGGTSLSSFVSSAGDAELANSAPALRRYVLAMRTLDTYEKNRKLVFVDLQTNYMKAHHRRRRHANQAGRTIKSVADKGLELLAATIASQVPIVTSTTKRLIEKAAKSVTDWLYDNWVDEGLDVSSYSRASGVGLFRDGSFRPSFSPEAAKVALERFMYEGAVELIDGLMEDFKVVTESPFGKLIKFLASLAKAALKKAAATVTQPSIKPGSLELASFKAPEAVDRQEAILMAVIGELEKMLFTSIYEGLQLDAFESMTGLPIKDYLDAVVSELKKMAEGKPDACRTPVQAFFNPIKELASKESERWKFAQKHTVDRILTEENLNQLDGMLKSFVDMSSVKDMILNQLQGMGVCELLEGLVGSIATPIKVVGGWVKDWFSGTGVDLATLERMGKYKPSEYIRDMQLAFLLPKATPQLSRQPKLTDYEGMKSYMVDCQNVISKAFREYKSDTEAKFNRHFRDDIKFDPHTYLVNIVNQMDAGDGKTYGELLTTKSGHVIKSARLRKLAAQGELGDSVGLKRRIMPPPEQFELLFHMGDIATGLKEGETVDPLMLDRVKSLAASVGASAYVEK